MRDGPALHLALAPRLDLGDALPTPVLLRLRELVADGCLVQEAAQRCHVTVRVATWATLGVRPRIAYAPVVRLAPGEADAIRARVFPQPHPRATPDEGRRT